MGQVNGENFEHQQHGGCRADDPNRCQATMKRGQCNFPAVIGGTYCICHGGKQQLKIADKNNIHRYRLAAYQFRLDSLTDSTTIKSLRDEIAILRFLVQKQLESCENDILPFSSVIAMLISAIDSLVVSCTKVENSLKDFIDNENAFEIAENILGLVRVLVKDKFQAISDDFLDLLARLQASVAPSAQETQYKIKRWQEEILTFFSSEKIHSLRGEIGVLRLIIEEQLNRCHDAVDLVNNARPIMANVQKVEKLVVSCNRIEQSMGLLLSEPAAIAFGQELVTILKEHITDGSIIEAIMQQMG
jgi:hypothetical protein